MGRRVKCANAGVGADLVDTSHHPTEHHLVDVLDQRIARLRCRARRVLDGGARALRLDCAAEERCMQLLKVETEQVRRTLQGLHVRHLRWW